MIAMLLVLAKAAAQSPGTLPARFQHLTQRDGLVQTTVTAITQDSIGFMWFGTWDGLYRYDGTSLRRFASRAFDSLSIASASINDFALGHEGRLYISTEGNSIEVYDARTETFMRVATYLGNASSTRQGVVQNIGDDAAGNIFYDDIDGRIFAVNTPTKQVTCLNPDPAEAIAGRARAYAMKADGSMFVGTGSGGLYAFDADDQTFVRLLPAPSEGSREASSAAIIRGLATGDGDQLWIATERGLKVLDLETKTLRSGPAPLDKLVCSAIAVGPQRELWIGTRTGLYRYDPELGRVDAYLNDPLVASSVLSGEVLSLYVDRQQVLWVGTLLGVSRLPLGGKLMRGHYGDSYIRDKSGNDGVWDLLQTDNRELWIVRESGLDHFAADGALLASYLPHEIGVGEARTADANLMYIMEPSRGANYFLQALAFGEETVLFEFDPVAARVVRKLAMTPSNTIPSESSDVAPLHELVGSPHWLIIASTECPTRYDEALEKFITYCPPAEIRKEVPPQVVSSAFVAASGEAYFGMRQNGLLRFDDRTGTWQHYAYDHDDPRGISSNLIIDLAEDREGYVWVGTDGFGLSRLDPATGEFTHYNSQNSGLLNDVANAIRVDDRNRVWVSTNQGISAIDQRSGKVYNFGLEHGLQDLEFNSTSRFTAADGELFFGGIYGFNRFYPDSMFSLQRTPPTVISGVLVRGETISGAEGVAIPFLRKLTLAADQRDLEIQFAALEFAFPATMRIRYRLVGYGDEWQIADNRTSATYTNLPPGDYRFEVQAAVGASDFAGVGSALDIYIQPPWYRTWWAYLAYALFVAGAAYVAYGFRQNRARERRRERRQRAEAEQLRELDRVKTNFFTNVSHEFRTPLTLISGPLDDLLRADGLSKLPPQHRQNLSLARENAGRLNELVEELLDISQLEAGQLQSRPSAIAVEPFLELMLHEFRQLAARKGVRLRVEGIDEDLPTVTADPQHLQRILGNLISNGIKFTPSGGQVVLEVRLGGVGVAPASATPHSGSSVAHSLERPERATGGVRVAPASATPHGGSSVAHSLERPERADAATVHFSVRDTGRGIPAADLPSVFDRFFRVDESGATRTIGTGIGLSLARELARLEHGDLSVVSTEGSGSRFTLSLPIQRPADEVLESTPKLDALMRDGVPSPVAEARQGPAATEALTSTTASMMRAAAVLAKAPVRLPDADDERPSVLVVEDHASIRAYVAQQLGDRYRILEAADGAEGIRLAEQFLPDLIVSDVMMPITDGLELCDTLKASVHTSFIPIVLLTARSAQHQRLEGLRHQSDAYLTKPFDAEELALVVDKLIQERRRWRERFAGSGVGARTSTAGAVVISPAEEGSASASTPLQPVKSRLAADELAFLAEVDAALHECHGDETWTVEGFAARLHISRSHLHRQLVDLLGKPPSQLLREYRLQRATGLLREGEGNVSEVAYAVGFKSVAHFSNAFTELYGVRPSGWGAASAS